MKAKAAAVLTAFLVAALSASNAEAIPLNGAFSVAGGLIPVNGSNGALAPLQSATGLDFIPLAGGLPTPGVAGQFLVTSGTGDFAGFVGQMGTIKDFTFAGAGSLNYPTPPILALTSVTDGTFDLLSIAVVNQGIDPNGNGFVTLAGTGVFHRPGFDATSGSFIFTAQAAGTTFSWSASGIAAGTPIPEPATLSLLGLGLAAAALLGHRRKPGK